jgi:electron transfer flavoprotein beta subunit
MRRILRINCGAIDLANSQRYGQSSFRTCENALCFKNTGKPAVGALRREMAARQASRQPDAKRIRLWDACVTPPGFDDHPGDAFGVQFDARGLRMKILAAVKRVVDYNVKVRVKPDGSGVDIANVKMSMNPFDEIAVEEAVRLREKGLAEDVAVVSIGPQKAQEQLRAALAMGADRAILVKTEESLEPLGVAKILKEIALKESVDLIILGKQAIDDDSNQTGQMLAALLNWPQGAFASKLEFDRGKVRVTREVDGGLQTVELKLPAVITTDLRLNEPRYTSLPNIMKAKKKPLTGIDAASLGADIAPRNRILTTSEPPVRKAGIRVGSAAELAARLRDEAGVL